MTKNNQIKKVFENIKHDISLENNVFLIIKKPTDDLILTDNPDNYPKEYIDYDNQYNNFKNDEIHSISKNDGSKYVILSLENINKPFYERFESEIEKNTSKIQEFKYHMIRNNANKESIDMITDILELVNNKSTSLGLSSNDDDKIIPFLLGHEIAHINSSSLKKFNPNNILIHSKYTNEEINNINSALQSINSNYNSKSNEVSQSNFYINRNEIYADLVGIYSVYRNHGDNLKIELFLDKLREFRYINNYANDINGQSSHNTELSFSKNIRKELVNIAKSGLDKEEFNEKISHLTDKVFIQTLKKYGVTLKTDISPLNNEEVNKYGKNLSNGEFIYQEIAKNNLKNLNTLKEHCEIDEKKNYSSDCLTIKDIKITEKSKEDIHDEYKSIKKLFNENDIKMNYSDMFKAGIYNAHTNNENNEDFVNSKNVKKMD